MKKIICPIDFSKASLNAIEFAARIGKKHQSHLTLVYVFTEEAHNDLLSESADFTFDQWKQKVEVKLGKLVKEVNDNSLKKGLLHCDYTTGQGDLTKVIVRLAKEKDYSMIVMGTNGASDLTETYVGSNTVKVIDLSACPVLCIPEEASWHKFKKIVYASNFQEEDKQTIAKLVSFALPFETEIDILHVSHKDKLFEKAMYEDFKNELTAYVTYPHLKFTHHIFEDEVNQGIDQYMIRQNADLLVLLTKHRNFFEKIFHRSLSMRMSYFVNYPLLIFKIED